MTRSGANGMALISIAEARPTAQRLDGSSPGPATGSFKLLVG